MGLIDLPTSTDYAPWMNHSVPASSRDFSRPREGFWMSTTPLDVNDANLPDVNDGWFGDMIEKVKDFIRIGPSEEQKTEQLKEDEDKPVEKATENKKDKPDVKGKKQDKLIIAFQSFFSQSHPVIGKLYDGPKDGVMNDALKVAAQSAESKIAELTTPSIRGIIWNGNSFGTSPSDVKNAIDLIVKHKKTSFLNRKERIIALSSFLSK